MIVKVSNFVYNILVKNTEFQKLFKFSILKGVDHVGIMTKEQLFKMVSRYEVQIKEDGKIVLEKSVSTTGVPVFNNCTTEKQGECTITWTHKIGEIEVII